MTNHITDAQLAQAAALVRQSMLSALAQDAMEDHAFSEAFLTGMKQLAQTQAKRRSPWKNVRKSEAPNTKGNSMPKSRRMILIAAVIAAMIAAMTMLVGYTVLNGAAWFRNFFEEKLQQPLSPGQKEYIDQNSLDIHQSVTVDGYTLTIESAIADSRNAYLKLRLDGPSGEPLDADMYGYTLRRLPDQSGFEPIFFKADDPSLNFGAGYWEMLEDSNPNDNSVSILWVLTQSGDSPSFEENVLYQIHLTDWFAYYEDTGIDKLIVENGAFDLSITFSSLNQDEQSFLSEPVSTSYLEFAVEMTSFQLRTMSGSATYTGRDDEKGILCLVDSFVVLNNGTMVEIRPHVFGTGFCDFVLASPIVLSEVDYVQLRDGTKLYAAEP